MAKKFTPDYELSDILGLYLIRSNEGDEARLRAVATKLRSLCRLEYAVNIPAQYKAITPELRTPFVRDAWHRVTSSLVAKTPVIHITPRDDKKQEYRDAANIAERFDTAMIERMDKETGRDIHYNLTAQHVRDGESILKVVHRPDAWANFPKRASDMSADGYDEKIGDFKRSTDLPIAWRDVDRLSIVYEGGEYGDAWVIEYGEYTKPYLKARYSMGEMDGRLIDPKHTIEGRPYAEGLQPSSTGRAVKIEFFTAREWHVIVDGAEAPGYPKPNPYAPYLPYFRAPAYDNESLLYSLLFLVPRLDELLTMKLNWDYIGSYPNPVIETVPNASTFPALDGPVGNVGDSEAGNQSAFVWRPGELIEMPLGRKLSFLSPPPIGQDVNETIQLLKGLIDIAGVPSILRGISGSGDSGYLANQLRAAAEMSFKLAAVSLQRQMEKATEFTHWIISHIVRQTVYVQGWDGLNSRTGKPKSDSSKEWLGLDPDKQSRQVAAIDKLGPISFQYRPSLPTDEQARAMIALQLTNSPKPLYSRKYALESWLQEEDADSILEDMAVEEALEQEPLKSMVIENALREAGIIPPPPNPAEQLVGPDGMPLLPAGGIGGMGIGGLQPGGIQPIGGVNGQPMVPPGPGGLQPVPLANQMVTGTPAVPGVTIPPVPTPTGIPNAPGGRRIGMYPGRPGGPRR